jgi:hypothetical protein
MFSKSMHLIMVYTMNSTSVFVVSRVSVVVAAIATFYNYISRYKMRSRSNRYAFE